MQSSRSRRVKIIATLGPASADRETVSALFDAGADVFRINMSHASHDAMRERVAMIRSIEEEKGRPIGILVDLQGPNPAVVISLASRSTAPSCSTSQIKTGFPASWTSSDFLRASERTL